jgi:hypothetical protein
MSSAVAFIECQHSGVSAQGLGQGETGVAPGCSDLQALLAVWNAGEFWSILLRLNAP